MDSEEFRRFGVEVIERIARYQEEIERYPVRSQVRPGDIAALLPAHAPEAGEDMAAILADVDRIVVPGLTHWQHPMFMAFFPSISSPPSVLGEALTAGFGVNGMMWESSPAATELEARVLDWLREAFGLPPAFQGVIQDTASIATLCAAFAARERASGHKGMEEGGRAFACLTAYGSKEAHSSVEKAAVLAGFGRVNFRPIPSDDAFAMRTDLLAKAIETDIANGLTPAFCVATLGTTALGGFDNVAAVGEICKRHGIWLHVDAAWAGSALVLPEQRAMIAGIEHADSIVINPHKWLMTSVDCSVLYVRDVENYTRAFSNDPEYLRTAQGSSVTDYRNWGIALGRRFRSLKLWFVVRRYGLQGLRRMIASHIALAHKLADRVAQDADFAVVAPPRLALFAFRYCPKGVDDQTADALNVRLLDAINNSGDLYLTRATVHGRAAIRVSVGQVGVNDSHMEKAWAVIRREADKL